MGEDDRWGSCPDVGRAAELKPEAYGLARGRGSERQVQTEGAVVCQGPEDRKTSVCSDDQEREDGQGRHSTGGGPRTTVGQKHLRAQGHSRVGSAVQRRAEPGS